MHIQNLKRVTFALVALLLFNGGSWIEESFAGISYEQSQRAEKYAKDQYRKGPNYYLAAKGIKTLLSKLPTSLPVSSKVLDFGCGPGTMSSFYHDLGYQVTGVDISQSMIDNGKKQYPLIDFRLIEKGPLPFNHEQFDAAFTSFVLLEIGDREEIVSILKEIKRVLKKGAPLFVVATSENIYKYKQYHFVASRTDFPENDLLKSGQRVKLQLKTLDFPFEDYFWSDADYRDFFQKAGFHSVTLEQPLGSPEDEDQLGVKWQSEKEVSPLSVYLVQ